MPANLLQALRALIGQTVCITTEGGVFTGTVASVTDHLVILSTSAGVLYINPADINAVGTK